MTTIQTKTTYLEMRSPADLRPVTAPGPGITVEALPSPTVDCYRSYYRSVGADYNWVNRLRMEDDALRQIIHDEGVEIYALRCDGQPAGFSELDRRQAGEIELAYFGLFPSFIGRGLGKYFLWWTVDRAWSYQPRRVWLHTCDLDHPAALPNYQKAGFRVYDVRWIKQPILSP